MTEARIVASVFIGCRVKQVFMKVVVIVESSHSFTFTWKLSFIKIQQCLLCQLSGDPLDFVWPIRRNS